MDRIHYNFSDPCGQVPPVGIMEYMLSFLSGHLEQRQFGEGIISPPPQDLILE